MHQLITRSDTSIPADCYARRLWWRCRVTSGYDWTDICQPWGEGERPVLLRCLAVSADASSNQACRRTLFIHKTICCLRRNWSFLCSVISQGKVVALDRWGGKWNHLSMTRRVTTDYAKNYCNRTLIVKVIVENVVTCFLGHSVEDECYYSRLAYTTPIQWAGPVVGDMPCIVLRHLHLSFQ